MAGTVYEDARAPEALQINLTPTAGTVPDLSVVTAASLEVWRPGASTAETWTVTLSNQSATTLTLTHVYAADGSDVPNAGQLVIIVHLTTPGGLRRCEPKTLSIIATH